MAVEVYDHDRLSEEDLALRGAYDPAQLPVRSLTAPGYADAGYAQDVYDEYQVEAAFERSRNGRGAEMELDW